MARLSRYIKQLKSLRKLPEPVGRSLSGYLDQAIEAAREGDLKTLRRLQAKLKQLHSDVTRFALKAQQRHTTEAGVRNKLKHFLQRTKRWIRTSHLIRKIKKAWRVAKRVGGPIADILVQLVLMIIGVAMVFGFITHTMPPEAQRWIIEDLARLGLEG